MKIVAASPDDFRAALPPVPGGQLRRYWRQYHGGVAFAVRDHENHVRALGGIYQHEDGSGEAWLLPPKTGKFPRRALIRAGALLLAGWQEDRPLFAYVDQDQPGHQRFARWFGFADMRPPQTASFFGRTYDKLEFVR